MVAQDGSGTVRTITEAVAMARDGDTVLVKPGTYTGSIAITTDITLRGDGDRKVIVLEFAADGSKHERDSCCEAFAYGILLYGSDARVGNLTVHGLSEAVAIPIDGGAPVIDGVDILLDGDPWGGHTGEWYKRSAFRIQGGSSAEIRDSTWDGHTRVQTLGANSPTFEDNVITAQEIRVGSPGNQPVIRGNTFLEGGFSWPDSGSGGIAEDNDIVGCIGVAAGNDPIIRGNRIQGGCGTDPSSAAIGIGGPSAAVVVDNEITDSPYGIQVATGAKPQITGNTILGSSSAAIVVDNGAAPTIDGNIIEKNATGIEVLGAPTPVMTGNTLCDNGTDLGVPDGSTLTLAGNTICGVAVSAAP
ncbi:MAG: pectinesterase family protein [Chloroflexi bacterium]|nr:pectinesterase family protein [Chloroflexota bacterium]